LLLLVLVLVPRLLYALLLLLVLEPLAVVAGGQRCKSTGCLGGRVCARGRTGRV
jgi:hypothetical protein